MYFLIWDGRELSVRSSLATWKPSSALLLITQLDLCSHFRSLPTDTLLVPVGSAQSSFPKRPCLSCMETGTMAAIAVRIQIHYFQGLIIPISPVPPLTNVSARPSYFMSQPHGSNPPPRLQCPALIK